MSLHHKEEGQAALNKSLIDFSILAKVAKNKITKLSPHPITTKNKHYERLKSCAEPDKTLTNAQCRVKGWTWFNGNFRQF